MQTIATRVIEISPNGMIDKASEYDDYLENEEVKQRRLELYNSAVTV